MAGKIYQFPPRDGDPTNLTVYVLQMYTGKGFWGALGVYVNIEECKKDARMAFQTRAGFVKYRIEAVQLVPLTAK